MAFNGIRTLYPLTKTNTQSVWTQHPNSNKRHLKQNTPGIEKQKKKIRGKISQTHFFLIVLTLKTANLRNPPRPILSN